MSEQASAHWHRVERALLCYRERFGAPAPFWLRDDDAVAPSAALDRLLGMAREVDVPVSLAVIPAGIDPALRPYLDALPSTCVLQHGFAHAVHAPPGRKKCEFPAERDLVAMRDEIADGRMRLDCFAGFVPIFVPPWNRIAPTVAAALPALGFAALSTYGDRRRPQAAPGLATLGTHVDPVAWHDGRGFLGHAAVLAALAGRLERLVAGEADAGEPTGLLTHHLVHDDETFAFLDELLQFLARRGLTRWLSGAMLLEEFGRDEATETT